MAIYPTKMSKINSKSNKFKAGVTLTSIFSVLFILLIFNFFQVFTKLIIGTFGLLIYPVCLFCIVLGILLMLNKEMKTTKSILVFSILWMITFILILQLATSTDIDKGFSIYMSTIFKDKYTAGGALFGLILYPLYYLTYDVASYIILLIILVIFTSILIDRIYVDTRNKKALGVLKKQDFVDIVTDEDDEEIIEEDEQEEKISNINVSDNDDEEIFIADEEDSEQKAEAKSILGLSKDIIDKKEDKVKFDYTQKLEKQIDNSNDDTTEKIIKNKDNKPNIYIHDDDFNSIENISNTKKIIEEKPIIDKDAERKKAALDYLNISRGKFETKNKKSEFDNVSVKSETNKQMQSQQEENKLRINSLNNSDGKPISGINPFKQRENSQDIYDENFTKSKFNENKGEFAKNNQRINDAFGRLTEMAQKQYSGEVKDNIVESTSFKPVQISIDEPIKRPSVQQKIYKKPPTYVRPPLDLLKTYATNIEADDGFIAEKGNLIVDTLKAFKIDTRIINATKGPTFTRYELQMAPGISVNSVNNKINDLSMALESKCRVQVPIPGKNAFGIEVPNKKRITVGLREILESSNFQNSKSPLTFALGKDISGDCKVASIDKLVHTLVAGSTGSGKSVCLNSMLVSLLYKASPEDLKLILVDPKSVEFTAFNDLPHMLIPKTITECDKAVSALSWLVEEMDNRYKKLSMLGARKISEYNETPEVLSGQVPKMYYIVMIFDEVGDFMTRAKKEIEEKIMLLAAKSRACGIHLILATQRPTVDVITGTIKANLPSRIAFTVQSYNDSKTILDSAGAESLLGMGDMLFSPQGSNDMDRIQCCFIDNKELKSVIDFVKENNEAEFDESIEDEMFNKKDGFDSGNGAEDAFDPLLKDCLRYFIKAKKASASSLQAYFGIGYPKANKIVLQMEKAGFVSAGDNNGRRTLFITQQEFEERFGEDLDE